MARLRIVHFCFRPRHNVGDAAVVLAIRQLIEARTGPVSWSGMRLRVLQESLTARQLRAINRHDLAIVGGGGLYSHGGLPLDPQALAGIRIPLVVYGAGFNRNLDDAPLASAQIDSIHRLHERAALSSVRDERSRALLASLGHTAEYTGDPALFLAPRHRWWMRSARVPRIGLNFAAHDWRGQERLLDDVLQVCMPVLGEIAARHGAEICYLVHADAEKRLLPRLRRALPGLRVFHLPAPQLAWAYRQMNLVVSMMLHSSIMAFAAGVPFVNIGYDDKNRAFMSDIGRLGYFLPATDLTRERLLAAGEAAMQDGDALVSGKLLLQQLADRSAAFSRAVAGLVP